MHGFVRMQLVCVALVTSPASAQPTYAVRDPEVPRPPTLQEWLARFPDRDDVRVCVAGGTGEWKISLIASPRALRRARVRVRDMATRRFDRALARCLEHRLREGLASAELAPWALRSSREAHDEHVFRVRDDAAIERAYLDRRRYVWTVEQERMGLARCVAAVPASRFPLRVPIRIRVEGGPFVDWPSPPPAWWVAEESLRNCLTYFLGGVPHIGELPFEHRFVVELDRSGAVSVVPPED